MLFFASHHPSTRERLPRSVAKLPWVRDPAPIDETFGDVVPLQFAHELQRGDWRAARYVLTELGGGDLRRALTSRRLGGRAPVDAARSWVNSRPDDGIGHLVLGTALVDQAWEGLDATSIDPLGDPMFRSRLSAAETALWTAIEALPDAPEPWDALIWTGIGLRIPVPELALRYDQGHERSPFDSELTSTALQMLCAKWFGSHEQMFAYAREIVATAPDGSPALSVLPMAYIELALDRLRDLPIDEACAVLAGDAARDELREAAARSIHHPSFQQDAAGLRAANAFLVAFYEGGHDDDTHAVLDLLRGRYCARPFDYFGDPGRMCRKAEIQTAEATGQPVLAAAQTALLTEEPVFTWGERRLAPR